MTEEEKHKEVKEKLEEQFKINVKNDFNIILQRIVNLELKIEKLKEAMSSYLSLGSEFTLGSVKTALKNI